MPPSAIITVALCLGDSNEGVCEPLLITEVQGVETPASHRRTYTLFPPSKSHSPAMESAGSSGQSGPDCIPVSFCKSCEVVCPRNDTPLLLSASLHIELLSLAGMPGMRHDFFFCLYVFRES